MRLKRAADVVDVGVGDENLLELEAVRCKQIVDARDLLAGIDDDRFSRRFVAENGAVALQRADWKGLEDHGSSVCAAQVKRQTWKGLP